MVYIYWSVTCLFLELTFKLLCYNNLFKIDTIYLVLFSFLISTFTTLISSIFNKKVNFIISVTVISIITFIFASQYIYFCIYSAPFYFYSLACGGAGQALDFIPTVIRVILNSLAVFFFFMPYIVFWILKKNKILLFEKILIKDIAVYIITLTMIIIAIISVFFSDKNENLSSYELFNNSNNIILQSNKFGLIPSTILDFSNTVLKRRVNLEINSTLDKDTSVIANHSSNDYNITKIDFDKLISTETNTDIIKLHKYFKQATPTNKNEYTGVFKDKNLILVMAESFTDTVINKELTPTLYKLANEGINFTSFYSPLYPVSTSDGEYMALTALMPSFGNWSMVKSKSNFLPYTMANSLKSKGYLTFAYHNHLKTFFSRYSTIPNIGYDSFKTCPDLDIDCTLWPESDLQMIEASYKDFMDLDRLFSVYYISVSGHLEYNLFGNDMVKKNISLVDTTNYSDTVKSYIASQIELDRALEKLISLLKEHNKLDNTVIAVFGDHYPYGLNLDELNELSTASTKKDKIFTKNKNAFFIWSKDVEPAKITKLASNVDILPTLLNMFGINYDSRILVGKDIMSSSDELIVLSSLSYISKYGYYDSISNKFILNSIDMSIDNQYVDKNLIKAKNKLNISSLILSTNYYEKLGLKKDVN